MAEQAEPIRLTWDGDVDWPALEQAAKAAVGVDIDLLQPEGLLPAHAVKFEAEICGADMDDVELLLSEAGQLSLPDLAFASVPGRARYGTLRDILSDMASDVEQATLMGAAGASPAALAFVDAMNELVAGGGSTTVVVYDPAGLSLLSCPSDVADIEASALKRMWSESVELGCVTRNASQSTSIDALLSLLAGARRIVCLSGAGVSVESGVPAFRNPTDEEDKSVIWARYDPTKVFGDIAKMNDEEYSHYWAMRTDLLGHIRPAKPNGSHKLMKTLFDRGQLSAVITQNIDGLYAATGLPPSAVLELHGHLRSALCTGCGKLQCMDDVYDAIVASDGRPPSCAECGSRLRCQTVGFGEALDSDQLAQARKLVRSADVLLIMGTSMLVQPVNLLPGMALDCGAKLAVLNIGDGKYDAFADVICKQPCGALCDTVASRLPARVEAAAGGDVAGWHSIARGGGHSGLLSAVKPAERPLLCVSSAAVRAASSLDEFVEHADVVLLQAAALRAGWTL